MSFIFAGESDHIKYLRLLKGKVYFAGDDAREAVRARKENRMLRFDEIKNKAGKYMLVCKIKEDYYVCKFNIKQNGKLIAAGTEKEIDLTYMEDGIILVPGFKYSEYTNLDELCHKSVHGDCVKVNTTNPRAAAEKFICASASEEPGLLVPIDSKLTKGQYACYWEDGHSTNICIFEIKDDHPNPETQINYQEIQVLCKPDESAKETYEKIVKYLPKQKDAIDRLKPGEKTSVRVEVPQLYTEQVPGRKVFEPPINAKHILDLNLVKTADGVVSYQYYDGTLYIALPYLDGEATSPPCLLKLKARASTTIVLQSKDEKGKRVYSDVYDRDHIYKNRIWSFTYNNQSILILSNSADFVSDETYFNAGFIGLPYTDSKRNVFFYHDPDSLFRDHDAADIKASNDRTWRLFTNN